MPRPLIEKVCENCGLIYFTTSTVSKACCRKCAKALWRKKVKELGHNITNSRSGRKKGITPWNKNKKCPQLSGDKNGFYGKKHTAETIAKIKTKVEDTKRKNKSFNISQEEYQIGLLLKEKFKDLKTQYKSEKYPFNCDFYIPSLDLYIEYQGHWSHGIFRHKIYGAYDKNNLEHQALLKLWESKKSKYYNRAIKTWTYLDPLKEQYVRDNNLSLLKFYSIEEFMEWFNKLG